MRVIERKLRTAWLSDNNDGIAISNSSVRTRCAGPRTSPYRSLCLFGNEIARRYFDTGNVYFTLAGWNSVTTRSRLNHILDLRLFCKDFTPYIAPRRECIADAWYLISKVHVDGVCQVILPADSERALWEAKAQEKMEVQP
jgi:hypothetical protein